MVAIMESAGAFVYGCTPEEADRRLPLAGAAKSERMGRGNMDYDGRGNRRGRDGMLAWLFMDEDIVKNLAKMGCEAVYLNRCYGKGRDYIKLEGMAEIVRLDGCLRRMIRENGEEK